jgi:hypothetical protein
MRTKHSISNQAGVPLQLHADSEVTSLLWQILAGIGAIAVVHALAWHVLAVWVFH